MDASDQAAEQIVKMALAGSEMVVRLTGAGAKNIAAALMAAAAGAEKTRGKTTLAAMLRSDKELKVFPIAAHELEEFAREARRYGVLYVVVKQKKDPTRIDLLVKAEDASRINRIIERRGLGSLGTFEPEAEAAQAKLVASAGTPTVQAAEDLLDVLLAEPSPAESARADSPLVRSPEGRSLSEPTSGKGQPSGKAGESKTHEIQKPTRGSVRKKLDDIRTERSAHAAQTATPTPELETATPKRTKERGR